MEKQLTLCVRWTQPLPGDAGGRATEFGLQAGRDTVLQGRLDTDGSTLYETQATAYIDSRQRLRFRGPCVQGPPEEPFLYLAFRFRDSPAGWIGRAKAMLTTLDQAFLAALPEGAVLETEVAILGHRGRGHVQTWRLR
jgi:hypothetical protein